MADDRLTALPPLCALLLAGCGAATGPGGSADGQPFAGIGAGETVHFTGNEPFWSGRASGGSLTYSTPENRQAATIAVSRFAGRNGLSFSGDLDDRPFVLAITPGQCGDGMSDRRYPYTVTLQVKGERREGCAWTDKQPFTGPNRP